MRKVIISLLLILSAAVYLSLYTGENIFTGAEEDTKELTGIEYAAEKISYKNISGINIDSAHAKINVYLDPKSEYIVVASKNADISQSVSEKILYLKNQKENYGTIDIYIPDRIYNIYIFSQICELNIDCKIKSILYVRSEKVSASVNGFCGRIDLEAEEGYVSLKSGNLEGSSKVNILKEGTIYIDSKFKEAENYEFSVGTGAVKIEDKENENIYFDVYAIAVYGEYNESEPVNIMSDKCAKIIVNAENGVVYFE